ncbi:uncharacterized protein LOC112495197 [Cephus cinctus]|uniref:Uncharacterized protein LOC112495197 n=1 Tax=Cephus cinctus TaxID=211228 RepID=A0AAJ7W6U8_CEPCN|nr:uncharacterized protein LOC112495197 [Cephus cinctus]
MEQLLGWQYCYWRKWCWVCKVNRKYLSKWLLVPGLNNRCRCPQRHFSSQPLPVYPKTLGRGIPWVKFYSPSRLPLVNKSCWIIIQDKERLLSEDSDLNVYVPLIHVVKWRSFEKGPTNDNESSLRRVHLETFGKNDIARPGYMADNTNPVLRGF